MEILNAYSPSVRQAHPKSGKSLTEQHHEKACNINSIMAKYTKTGLITHINRRTPTFGDVTGADFQAAQNLVAAQKTIFHELPAQIRAEFNNDPAEYLALVETDQGVETLKAMLNPEPEPGPETPPEAPTQPPEAPVTEEPPVT